VKSPTAGLVDRALLLDARGRTQEALALLEASADLESLLLRARGYSSPLR